MCELRDALESSFDEIFIDVARHFNIQSVTAMTLSWRVFNTFINATIVDEILTDDHEFIRALAVLVHNHEYEKDDGGADLVTRFIELLKMMLDYEAETV